MNRAQEKEVIRLFKKGFSVEKIVKKMFVESDFTIMEKEVVEVIRRHLHFSAIIRTEKNKTLGY